MSRIPYISFLLYYFNLQSIQVIQKSILPQANHFLEVQRGGLFTSFGPVTSNWAACPLKSQPFSIHSPEQYRTNKGELLDAEKELSLKPENT